MDASNSKKMGFDGLYWIFLWIFKKKNGFQFFLKKVLDYLLRLGVNF